MKKPSVYLIGATVLCDKLNLESFEAVENAFVKRGFSVVKPHDLFFDEEQRTLTDDEVITRRAQALRKCDFAVLIPGWFDDRFAQAEHTTARFSSIPVHRLLAGMDQFDMYMKKTA